MDLKNTKIIFVDIDGTLTNGKGEISDYTRRVFQLAKEEGILIVICSGRSSSFVSLKSIAANCSDYAICSTGNLVLNYRNNNIIYISEMNREDVKDLWGYCKKYNLKCTIHGTNCKYIPFMTKIDEDKTNKIVINDPNGINDSFCQIIISDDKKDCFPMLIDYLRKNHKNLMISNTNIYDNPDYYYFTDIIKVDSSKGIAIKKLIDYLNISPEETMCFGDSMNDLSMFKTCQFPVAMKNAKDDIKAYSKFITNYTNDEDGVAHFIEDFIL